MLLYKSEETVKSISSKALEVQQACFTLAGKWQGRITLFQAQIRLRNKKKKIFNHKNTVFLGSVIQYYQHKGFIS